MTFTGEAVLDLLPVIGASEPLSVYTLPSDGGFAQCDVCLLLSLQFAGHFDLGDYSSLAGAVYPKKGLDPSEISLGWNGGAQAGYGFIENNR